MTRDEAVKILRRIWSDSPQHDLADSYADAFVALGMLKFDEPPRAEQSVQADMKFHRPPPRSVAYDIFRFRFGTAMAHKLLEEIESFDLKICEK